MKSKKPLLIVILVIRRSYILLAILCGTKTHMKKGKHQPSLKIQKNNTDMHYE